METGAYLVFLASLSRLFGKFQEIERPCLKTKIRQNKMDSTRGVTAEIVL